MVFTSMRGSERMFLGSTCILPSKPQMCLHTESSLAYSSSGSRKCLLLCVLTSGRCHQVLGMLHQGKESSEIKQRWSHLFLKKGLCFIFNLTTVISQFSFSGESLSRCYDNLIFPSLKCSLLCQSHVLAS